MSNTSDRIVREPERRAITGRSPARWWRDEKAGKAPLRLRIGDNAVGWRLSELMSWLDSRQAGTTPTPVCPGVRRGRKPKAAKGE